jgi:hypothetical protein
MCRPIVPGARLASLLRLGTGPSVPAPIKKRLNHRRHIAVMRVAMAAVVALLILNFVDEHFNDARYTRAATVMLSNIARSFS